MHYNVQNICHLGHQVNWKCFLKFLLSLPAFTCYKTNFASWEIIVSKIQQQQLYNLPSQKIHISCHSKVKKTLYEYGPFSLTFVVSVWAAGYFCVSFQKSENKVKTNSRWGNRLSSTCMQGSGGRSIMTLHLCKSSNTLLQIHHITSKSSKYYY